MVAHIFIIKEPSEAHQVDQLTISPRSRYHFCLAIELLDAQSCLGSSVLQCLSTHHCGSSVDMGTKLCLGLELDAEYFDNENDFMGQP